jgi:dTDP-4-dehydrorhamnose reductase
LGGHLLHSLISNIQNSIGSALKASVIAYTYNSSSQPDFSLVSWRHDVKVIGVKVDITDEKQVQSCVSQINPDIIIHTAAFCNTGLCDKSPQLADSINVIGTKNIINACVAHNIFIVHMSTDWVYDGSKKFSVEIDVPSNVIHTSDEVSFQCGLVSNTNVSTSPSGGSNDESKATSRSYGFSVYGNSKWKAEQLFFQAQYDSNFSQFCILRSALIYGPASPFSGKPCFLDFMVTSLKKGNSIGLFSDEWRTPVHVFDLMDAIKLCILNKDKIAGQVFNSGGETRLNRYDMGVLLANIMQNATSSASSSSDVVNSSNNHFQSNETQQQNLHQLLQSTTLAEAGMSGKRPLDISMNSDKLMQMVGWKSRSFEDGIATCL